MKVLHGTVLFTVLTVVVAGGNDFRSDYKYYSGAQGWFKLHKAPANWEDARLRCSLEGAVLASPINEAIRDVMYNVISNEEHLSSSQQTGVHNTLMSTHFKSLRGANLAASINEAIRDSIRRTQERLSSRLQTGAPTQYNSPEGASKEEDLSSGLHTGVHNTITPTQYNSLEGVPMSDMPVEPVFTAEYNATPSCMRLESKDGLVASSCNDTRPYLCYKEKTADLVITECGTVDTGYQLNSTTGHCYKFHRGVLSWPLAFSTCEAEGGYLAVINSDEEGALVVDLMAQNPADTILGPNTKGIHVGFYDWDQNYTWKTVHGQSLEDAGFAQWGENQPDHSLKNGETPHCGAMFRRGVFDDVWCFYLYPFICEKDPKSLRS